MWVWVRPVEDVLAHWGGELSVFMIQRPRWRLTLGDRECWHRQVMAQAIRDQEQAEADRIAALKPRDDLGRYRRRA